MKSLIFTRFTFLLFILPISFSFFVKADQTITNIQSILKVQGYDIKIIDGIAGKNTVREIRNWQFLNNFSETGKINSQQLNILIQQNDNQMVLSKEELKIIQNRNQQLKNVEKANKKKSYGKDFNYYMEKTIYLYITYFFIFILGTVFLLFSEKQTSLYNWFNIILYNQFSYIVIIFGSLILFLVFFSFFLTEYFFNWSFLEKNKNLYNFSLLGIIIQIIGIYLCTAIKQDRRYKDNFRNEGDKIFATVGSVIYFIGATIIHTSLLIIIILDI